MEMSRYLKDIDPYQHLVTTSISHRDIQGLNSIPYIDFNQKHIYKHSEKIPGIYPDYIQTFGKPYVIGEFGYRWEDDNPIYSKEFKYDFKRGLWYGLFSPTPVLPMSWWWELFDNLNMEPYFRSVQMINQDMLAAGQGEFNPLPANAEPLHAQAVQCGRKIYVYLLNESHQDFQKDLKVGVKSLTGNYSIQLFNPDNRSYSQIKSKIIDHAVQLDGFRLNSHQSSILILSPF